jgi:gamma-glutamyltranspeptidase/glutathione hydrolase
MTFTTRPELLGTFGMVSTTHWLASQAGMKMLEAGGTAADAAVAAGFRPERGGAASERPVGRGARARPARGRGHAAGALRTGRRAPGRDGGALPVRGARHHPGLGPSGGGRTPGRLRRLDADAARPRPPSARRGAGARDPLRRTRAPDARGRGLRHRGTAGGVPQEWPTSAPVWLPGVARPRRRAFPQPRLRAMWRRLVAEGEAAGPGREAQIEAARRAHASGFVAEAIDTYLREACVLDATGERRKGVLTGQDMASGRRPGRRPSPSITRAGPSGNAGPGHRARCCCRSSRCWRTTTWARWTHRAGVRAPGGRGAETRLRGSRGYYGDPALHDIPVDVLLSRDHNAAHRADIGPEAAATTIAPGPSRGMRRRSRPSSPARHGARPRPVSARANPPWRTW